MKQITLISGVQRFISDEEAENIKKIATRGGFIELRDGTFVNCSSISLIGEPEKIPFWSTYQVQETKLGKYINRDGEKCFLSPENIKEIRYEYPVEQENHPGVLRSLQPSEPVLPGGMQTRRELQ